MRQLSIVFVLVFISMNGIFAHNENNLYRKEDNEPSKPTRYLLYDVNPGEGFNLRRDVYMRVANLVKFLNEDEKWTLVLPPWGKMYHWQTKDLTQMKIPWSNFFDLESLSLHVPVMEFDEYIKITGRPMVNEVYYLQRFAEGWTKWEEKIEKRDCIENPRYSKNAEGKWRGQFFGYSEFYADKFTCLSTQAYAVSFKPFLMKNTTARSVFLDRAESLIHGQYSEWSKEFWTARRSMVFSKKLRGIADEFRKKNLDSDDKSDKTELQVWTEMERKPGDAKGGPYVAVHLRRKDYLYAHGKQVPSLENAAKQIIKYLDKYKIKKLYVASDAPAAELADFKKLFKGVKVYRYQPEPDVLQDIKDGGQAIIDQWICAHARIFIGSYVSTFTFRIHEERQILGFKPESTFNRLCGDEEAEDCEQPTQWKMVL